MIEDEKAQLYKQAVHQANEQVLLERMRLYGFWRAHEGLPPDPPAEAEERSKIEQEVAELLKIQAKIKNPEKALAEERQRRWEESKQRRAAAKAKRAEAQAPR